MAADFTTTITTTGTLNGNTYSVTQASTIAAVTEVINRRVTVPVGSQVDLLTIGAAVGPGQVSTLSQMIILNKDSTNFIRLRLEDTGGNTSDHKIEAGRSFVINNDQLNVSETGVAFVSFDTIDTIALQADTVDVVIEFIALQI